MFCLHRFSTLLIAICAAGILSCSDTEACTVPVFRYALDNWPGKSDDTVKNTPVLDRIANDIIAGNSAVWIQIDSGDQQADDAAFQLLESRLRFFESVAELPEIDPNDPTSQIGPGPKLELKFTAFRIKRDDPVAQLIAGSKVESLPPAEPWIAPVFGRGRVLGVWEASRMDEEGIDEACFYLTGACSCQVKVQNPGWDLVMNVDWNQRLTAAQEQSPNIEAEPAPVQTPKQTAQQSAADTFTRIIRPKTTDINLVPIIGIGLLLAGALPLFNKLRARKQ